MDWNQLTAEAAAVEALAGAEREAYLGQIEEADARLGLTLRDYLARTDRTAGFMQTSSGQLRGDFKEGLTDGEQVGVWRVEAVLGAGGMGVVYRVRRDDGHFQQQAALKLMRASDPDARDRFRQERERLASLEHPGISRIIDGGDSSQGRPYMVVELVDGQPIDAHVRERSLSRAQVISLLLELSAALSHAHGRLVLHRDVKPSNVLVDDKGSVRLIDFGVSAILDTDGAGPGPLTIAYAAPELLMATAPTVAADVFSTGMLAHQVLTGGLPARTAEGGAAVDASLLQNRDLAAILTKATASEPEARYLSIDAFAVDLAAVLRGRPVHARGRSAVYVGSKFLRRHPVGSALAAGVVLSLAGGLVGTSWMAHRAQTEADRAKAALARADRYARFQKTYVDVVLRLFGGEGNTERLTDLLLNRASQAQAHRDKDPELAAEINLAIARAFVERNDFRSAAGVLEAWMATPYGSPRLIVDGRLYLGLCYRYLGNFDRAKPLLEKAIEYYEATGEPAAYEHILATRALAYSVSDPAPVFKKLDLLIREALERDVPIEEKIFLYDTWGSIAYRQGDFSEAHVRSKAVLALLDEHPLAEVARRDNLRLFKSIYEVFLTRDFEAARKVLDEVEKNLEVSKGASLNTVFLYEYRGYMSSEEGDFESAIRSHQRAIELALEFSEPGSRMYVQASSFLLETLIDAERWEQAIALFEELDPIVEDKYGGRHKMFVLAKARLRLERQGVEAASAVLTGIGMSKEVAGTGLVLSTRLNRLIARGVTPAPSKP